MSAPFALLGLLLIPVLILLERWRRRPRAMVWPSLLLWRALGPGEAASKRRIEPLLILECVAVALLSVAAAGPSFAAGVAGRTVVVHLDTAPRMGARLADGRTALEATRAELDRIRGSLAPQDQWRLIEGIDTAPVRGDIRILATNRPDAEGGLLVGRAPAGGNIGIDAVDATGFSVRRESGDAPVRVEIDKKRAIVASNSWIEPAPSSSLRVLETNNHPGDDLVRVRPVRLKVRTDSESPLVLAALHAGLPTEAGEPADLVLATTGGVRLGRVRGAACRAQPGLFDGLFLDDCRWDDVRGANEKGLLQWEEWSLARWLNPSTLWLGLPVDREWDEHGTLALVVERAKRKRARALLEANEVLVGDRALAPAPGFIETRGVDRPWDGTLPPAAVERVGSFALRALLAVAAAIVLIVYALRLAPRSV